MEDNKRPGVGFGVMLLRDGRILLGKRNSDPIKASSLLHGEGTWTMPGGKLDFHEGLEAGARREVKEETGIEVGRLEIISVSNDIVPDNHFVTIGFFSKDFRGEPGVMEPEEIIEWRWFSIDNLPAPLFQPCIKIVSNYLNKKLYQDG